MTLAATIKGAAAVVVSIGTIGGGALYLDERHELRAEAEKHEQEFISYRSEQNASAHVLAIQNWIKVAREESTEEGTPAGICDALIAELTELCSEVPTHYLCTAEQTANTLKRAGCE